jgi:hypothetical protein
LFYVVILTLSAVEWGRIPVFRFAFVLGVVLVSLMIRPRCAGKPRKVSPLTFFRRQAVENLVKPFS